MSLGQIETVADDEPVFDLEAEVVHGHRLRAGDSLTQKRADLQRPRVPLAQELEDLAKSSSRIDDVFHDDHVAARDVLRQVADEPNLSRGTGARPVGRDPEKIQRDRRPDSPRQVAQKEDRPLENADEKGGPAAEIPVDRVRQAFHALANGAFFEDHLRNLMTHTSSLS